MLSFGYWVICDDTSINPIIMRNKINRWAIFLITGFSFSFLSAGKLNNEKDPVSDKIIFYKYEMTEQIAPAIWRITKKSFEEVKCLLREKLLPDFHSNVI